MCRTVPARTSAYADEGTLAHALAAHCIRRNLVPDHMEVLGTEAGLQRIPPAMRTHVGKYVRYVRDRKPGTGPGTILRVEETYHLTHLDAALWGTADAVIATWDGLLEVVDFKYGSFVAVDADANLQLGYYALGELARGMYAAVRLTVVQPRADHAAGPVRSYDTTPERLEAWAHRVLLPGLAAARAPGAPLRAGNHCMFCDAKEVCPERLREKLERVFG